MIAAIHGADGRDAIAFAPSLPASTAVSEPRHEQAAARDNSVCDAYGVVANGRNRLRSGAGEQEGSKRRAMQGGSGRCEANELAGQAAFGYSQPSAGFVWHARGLGFESP